MSTVNVLLEKETYKYIPESEELENLILSVLRKKPATTETISRLTGISRHKISLEIRRLRKWHPGLKIVTTQKLDFWAFKPRGVDLDGNRKTERKI